MRCMKCSGTTACTDSREREVGKIRRRRICKNCGYRFSTIELPMEPQERSKNYRLARKSVVVEFKPYSIK